MPSKKVGSKLKKLAYKKRRGRPALKRIGKGINMYGVRQGSMGGGTPYYIHQPVYHEVIKEPDITQKLKQTKETLAETKGVMQQALDIGRIGGRYALGAASAIATGAAAFHTVQSVFDPSGAAKAAGAKKADEDLSYLQGLTEGAVSKLPDVAKTVHNAASGALDTGARIVANAVTGTTDITKEAAGDVWAYAKSFIRKPLPSYKPNLQGFEDRQQKIYNDALSEHLGSDYIDVSFMSNPQMMPNKAFSTEPPGWAKLIAGGAGVYAVSKVASKAIYRK